MTEKELPELDINVRWEEGMEHHIDSMNIFNVLDEYDFILGGDRFCFKAGGDGDNGEHLMYLLDIHFEARDRGMLPELREALVKKRDELYAKNK